MSILDLATSVSAGLSFGSRCWLSGGVGGRSNG